MIMKGTYLRDAVTFAYSTFIRLYYTSLPIHFYTFERIAHSLKQDIDKGEDCEEKHSNKKIDNGDDIQDQKRELCSLSAVWRMG